MHADKVELSWDATKHNWLIRIEAGSEVLRRHASQPQDAGDEILRAAALQTATDDGYEVDPSRVAIVR